MIICYFSGDMSVMILTWLWCWGEVSEVMKFKGKVKFYNHSTIYMYCKSCFFPQWCAIITMTWTFCRRLFETVWSKQSCTLYIWMQNLNISDLFALVSWVAALMWLTYRCCSDTLITNFVLTSQYMATTFPHPTAWINAGYETLHFFVLNFHCYVVTLLSW